MTDIYGAGDDSGQGASGRPITREPYRGARIRNRRTGEVRVWNGGRYVAQNSQERLTAQERQSLSEAQAEAGRYAQMMPDLDRFEQLNTEVPTGSLSHRFGIWAGDMPRVLGIDSNGPGPNGDTSMMMDEMRSITDRLTPAQRAPGSGSSSNLDVGMFRSGLPNIGRRGPANSDIISGYRRQGRDAQDRAEFMDWYWPRSGSLQGAEEAYAQYRAARQQDPSLTWRRFFGADTQTRAPGVASLGARATGSGGTPGGGSGQRETWVRDPATGRLMRQR